MVRWRKIIFNLFRASLIPIIIPLCVIYILFHYFGFTVEVFMAIITIIWVYITVIQAEVSLRQVAMHEASYQPNFKIDVHFTSLSVVADNRTASCDKPDTYVLINEGKFPAYNIILGITEIINNKQKPLSRDLRIDKPEDMLAPGGNMPLLKITSETIKKQIIVRVSYQDIFGIDRETVFMKLKGVEQFILIRTPIDVRRGIVLKSIEDLQLMYKLLKILQKKK
ncbi:MAG: hypothetical protein DRJ30_05460 [Candidatus Methanomethylicota archaeon]|nr:MAG: hypothetical protein DRJ30_05460 [Candidatus Verstraetearchaeota archaeon]